MKRDWSLMGDIFNAIEEETLEGFIERCSSEDKTKIFWHLELLLDAGYIKGVGLKRYSSGEIFDIYSNNPRITLSGYDFADLVKDKKILNQIKNQITDAGYLVSLETIKAFAPQVIKGLAKKYLGIES